MTGPDPGTPSLPGAVCTRPMNSMDMAAPSGWDCVRGFGFEPVTPPRQPGHESGGVAGDQARRLVGVAVLTRPADGGEVRHGRAGGRREAAPRGEGAPGLVVLVRGRGNRADGGPLQLRRD